MGEYPAGWDHNPEDDNDNYDDGQEVYYEQLTPVREGSTVTDLYDECLEPTLLSALDQVVWLLCACITFRLFTQLDAYMAVSSRRQFSHLSSIVFGIAGLSSVIGPSAVYTIIFATSTYFCLKFCAREPRQESSYKFMAVLLLVYLVTREYFNILPDSWEQVRGIHMIMVLKTLSLCFEISHDYQQELPPFLEYTGYIFCPATVVFGPWIPFSVYRKLFEPKKWNLRWIVHVGSSCFNAFAGLAISSCFVYWTFLGISSRYLIAIRDAVSVRFSHYFISFMSETTALLGGFPLDSHIEVTEPSKIELPRSLVEVVVHWNMPMHRWLKIHVFRPASNLGTFPAVLITFLVSSVLHGMNFGLTMVLLSLGLYTYVEHTLREKLASVFDACIRARQCPVDCRHQHKSDLLVVRLVNFFFGFHAFFHLAYLGIMMDKTHYDDEFPREIFQTIYQDLRKWADFDFVSHWCMFVIYLGSLVI